MTLRGQIAVVAGTRPEIIKLAPVLRRLGESALVIHSGQHYDPGLRDAFFAGARLPGPELTLHGIGGRDRATQIGILLGQLGEMFTEHSPAAVIVQGDTNTTSAAAQAANYTGIPVVHVEAGLRSHDRAMPEELNRRVVGVLADLHCAATTHNVDNLRHEGVPARRITRTGNTIVEATLDALAHAGGGRVPPGRYVLATVHRPENTDDPGRLATILRELAALELPVVFPVHPRTRARVEAFGLHRLLRGLQVIEPVDHGRFLTLAASAALLISDSGGVQEECTVLKKPLIVVRNSTERPEAIAAGFAQLLQPGPQIGDLARQLLADPTLPDRLHATPSPYGDRHAAHRIVTATRLLIRAEAGRALNRDSERITGVTVSPLDG